MQSKLTGGKLYDPAQKIDGEIRDIFIGDGVIVQDPGAVAQFDEIHDVAGQVVMAGSVSIHSHIAGGNVNTARLLLPKQHRNPMARRLNQPLSSAKWSTIDTAYRSAKMGYTTVAEPAMSSINRLDVHYSERCRFCSDRPATVHQPSLPQLIIHCLHFHK